MKNQEVRPKPEVWDESTESLRELVTVLHRLPQKEREKFYYMAQGAALVSPQDEQGKAV